MLRSLLSGVSATLLIAQASLGAELPKQPDAPLEDLAPSMKARTVASSFEVVVHPADDPADEHHFTRPLEHGLAASVRPSSRIPT